ncbi:MAG TPA: hypothetical protein VGB24_01905 [Longimicrobium sp.]|jgi:hypothetical protein|uniref:hypothetical protein n=1 Tax=Longimicrobium sp. TaxID=2029185 RepID=UPI002ED7EA9B
MTTLRTLLIGVLVALTACTPASSEQTRQSAERGDTSVAGFLRAHGFRLDSVVAERESYLAALGRRASDDAVHLFALRRPGPALRLLGAPEAMMENYAPQRIGFLSLGGSGTDAFFYTHDIPVEGVIGTAVYAIQADSMVMTYGSEEDNECRPAAIRDVNGDGRMELVTYTRDPSDGDCGSECHLDIDEQFGMGPQWVYTSGPAAGGKYRIRHSPHSMRILPGDIGKSPRGWLTRAAPSASTARRRSGGD